MRTVGMVKKNKTKNLKDADVATLKKEKRELEEKVKVLEAKNKELELVISEQAETQKEK